MGLVLGGAAFGQTPVDITPGASGVSASTSDTNDPANAVDGSLATRWSGNGDGAWIRFDLGAPRTVSSVRIAFFSGNIRQSRFDMQVSADGMAWSVLRTGVVSGGTSTQQETFDFTDRAARYVRYFGHGNTLNAWNSLTEVDIFAVP
jgi:hypothetical protein